MLLTKVIFNKMYGDCSGYNLTHKDEVTVEDILFSIFHPERLLIHSSEERFRFINEMVEKYKPKAS